MIIVFVLVILDFSASINLKTIDYASVKIMSTQPVGIFIGEILSIDDLIL
jgi:hypothetical protein